MSDSQMIRVPTPLVPVVRELSRLHREHNTEQILEAISALIARLDSTDIEIDSCKLNNDIKAIIERLESRVMALEAAPSRTSPIVNTPSTVIAKVPAATKAPPQGKWGNLPTGLLTTSEAFAELKRRGWQGKNSTLRRKLKKGTVPLDLQQLGLMVDPQGFERRRETPKDNRVTWLSFDKQ